MCDQAGRRTYQAMNSNTNQHIEHKPWQTERGHAHGVHGVPVVPAVTPTPSGVLTTPKSDGCCWWAFVPWLGWMLLSTWPTAAPMLFSTTTTLLTSVLRTFRQGGKMLSISIREPSVWQNQNFPFLSSANETRRCNTYYKATTNQSTASSHTILP